MSICAWYLNVPYPFCFLATTNTPKKIWATTSMLATDNAMVPIARCAGVKFPLIGFWHEHEQVCLWETIADDRQFVVEVLEIKMVNTESQQPTSSESHTPWHVHLSRVTASPEWSSFHCHLFEILIDFCLCLSGLAVRPFLAPTSGEKHILENLEI